jgi:hypothetical protein
MGDGEERARHAPNAAGADGSSRAQKKGRDSHTDFHSFLLCSSGYGGSDMGAPAWAQSASIVNRRCPVNAMHTFVLGARLERPSWEKGLAEACASTRQVFGTRGSRMWSTEYRLERVDLWWDQVKAQRCTASFNLGDWPALHAPSPVQMHERCMMERARTKRASVITQNSTGRLKGKRAGDDDRHVGEDYTFVTNTQAQRPRGDY